MGILAATGLGAAAGPGPAPVLPGPSGAPSNGSLYSHSFPSKIGVQWTNGDATSGTEIRFFSDAIVCPTPPIETGTVLRGNASPTATTFPTNDPATGLKCSYWIAHKKNGKYSAWHQVEFDSSCKVCPIA